jgi:hypothetical protein
MKVIELAKPCHCMVSFIWGMGVTTMKGGASTYHSLNLDLFPLRFFAIKTH